MDFLDVWLFFLLASSSFLLLLFSFYFSFSALFFFLFLLLILIQPGSNAFSREPFSIVSSQVYLVEMQAVAAC